MEREAPEELRAREALAHLQACVLFALIRDDPLAVAKNIPFRDHAPIKVAPEVNQCLIPSGAPLA